MNNEIKKNNRLTIILIVALFISPLVLSWYIFNYTDFIKMRGTSNHGSLITPPRPLENLALIDPLDTDRHDKLYGKWSLTYVTKTCEKRCMSNIYLMRQIHIAMDKYSLRVQRVMLLTEQPVDELKEKLVDYKGQQIVDTEAVDKYNLLKQFQLGESDNPADADRLYIIDPLGNLMMSYPPETKPRDIYEDLKKLLRGSRIG